MVDPQIAAANAAAIVSAGNAIGAGLAMTGMIGAGIGVGNIFGNFLSGRPWPKPSAFCRSSSASCSGRRRADFVLPIETVTRLRPGRLLFR